MRRREEIIDVLKRCFYVLKRKNLPIFGTDAKNLKEFTTTERDMNKGMSRFPTQNYRKPAEDLYDEGAGGAGTP